jgi:putrescine transport system substrate-binding protein
MAATVWRRRRRVNLQFARPARTARRTIDRRMLARTPGAAAMQTRNGARALRLALAGAAAGGGPGGPPPGTPTATDAAAASGGEEPLLNFANFIEEIAPETLETFTRETGIRVNYDTYELNQVLESRLLVGNTGLDLVVPSSNFIERQIRAGVYRKLDKGLLPNLRHLDPGLLAQLSRNDPGNQHAVPYLWGSFGYGYDVAKVEAALGGPAPDSWGLVFDPRYAAKLAQCGIIVIDAPWVMISEALLYLGRDPNSERPEDLAAAMEVLMAIRPYLREITASTVTQQMVDGQACIAIGVNGDFHLARKLAQENGRKVEIRYVVPNEGSMLWVDVLAIPADAARPRNAHRLIDFLMRPEVIARITEATGFANANASGTALVPAELRDDPTIYPDAATMQRLQVGKVHTDEYSRLQNREFTRFRTGQ